MEQFVKVLFRLEKDADGYPPLEVESLWCIPRAEGFEINNIPLYARNVSVGDVLEAVETADGALEFKRVVRRGGHSTFRVFLLKKHPNDPQHTMDELTLMGLQVEADPPSLISIDVPPTASLEGIEDYLIAGKEAGRWDAEEAFRATAQPHNDC